MLSPSSTSSARPLNEGADVPPIHPVLKEADVTQAFTSAPAELTQLQAPAPRSYLDQGSYLDQEAQSEGEPAPQKAQDASVTPTSSAQQAAPSTTYGPALFVQNLKESTLLINETVMTFLKEGDLSTSLKVLAVAGTAAAIAAATYQSISSGLGAAGFVLCNLATTLEKNSHSRAQFVIHASVLSGHFLMEGNEGLAAVNAVLAARMLTHSMIPQSNTKLNAAVAISGITISSMMFCCAENFSPGIIFQNVPLIGICVGGIASTLVDKFGWISRVVIVAIFSLMLPYHCVVSGSLFSAALSATLGYGILKTIQKKDLPKVQGKNLSVVEFFKALSTSDDTPESKDKE